MSEQDVKDLCDIRNQLKNERRKLDRNGNGQRHRVYEMEVEKEPQNFELTIKLHESTVNKLKMLS
jgi:hypothetical protein